MQSNRSSSMKKICSYVDRRLPIDEKSAVLTISASGSASSPHQKVTMFLEVLTNEDKHFIVNRKLMNLWMQKRHSVGG